MPPFTGQMPLYKGQSDNLLCHIWYFCLVGFFNSLFGGRFCHFPKMVIGNALGKNLSVCVEFSSPTKQSEEVCFSLIIRGPPWTWTRVCCVIASNQPENTHNTVKLESRFKSQHVQTCFRKSETTIIWTILQKHTLFYFSIGKDPQEGQVCQPSAKKKKLTNFNTHF